MPICITGMHRSGTSVVARLLNLCGLHLGRESDLVNPTPDNPEGYWENTRFVGIDEALLAEFGGAWDVPPVYPSGWEHQPGVMALRDQAVPLAQEFAECGRWGWKDPRASLTLSFWQELFPDLQVIVCVRNPLEVARSLYRRGSSSNLFGFNLWRIYNERLLASTRPEQRLVTHLDAYFFNPEAELRRVVEWLGWTVPDETIARACKAISTSLRHHRLPISELIRAGVSPEALELYNQLCAAAGSIYRQMLDGEIADQPETVTAAPYTAEVDTWGTARLLALQALIEKQQGDLDALEQEMFRLNEAFHLIEGWAHELEDAVREHEATTAAYRRALGPILPLLRALMRRR